MRRIGRVFLCVYGECDDLESSRCVQQSIFDGETTYSRYQFERAVREQSSCCHGHEESVDILVERLFHQRKSDDTGQGERTDEEDTQKAVAIA